MTFRCEDLTADCRTYIKELNAQSPIISTSHYLLRALYRKWGTANVDAELDLLFKQERDDAKHRREQDQDRC